MARDFFINGESLVSVRSHTSSAIPTLTELGLASDPVRVQPIFHHRDIRLDAFGDSPAEVQWMLAECLISFTLIHVDMNVLEECLRLSAGGPALYGEMARAGARLGNNLPRFAAGNNYISLTISSPVAARPYRFFFTYLENPPAEFPLGTEKSMIPIRFRCIPYSQDPYGGGLGAQNYVLYDRGSDA